MNRDYDDGLRMTVQRSSDRGAVAPTIRPESITRVISFTGGKGGVGKTNSVVNIAVALAQMGKSVLVLDADLGLANADILLGLKPRATLADLFDGTHTLDEIILSGPQGISLIPSASGVESLSQLDTGRRLLLLEAIEEIAHRFDYLLIDTQAGIGSDVMYFNSAASEIVCIITPDPTSLTDAYALIKILAQNYGERSFSVLVNNVGPLTDGWRNGGAAEAVAQEAEATYVRFAQAVERFLQVEVRYLGFVPSDAAVRDAVRAQRALLELYPSSSAALAYSGIARSLDADFFQYRVKGGMQFFFRHLLGMSNIEAVRGE